MTKGLETESFGNYFFILENFLKKHKDELMISCLDEVCRLDDISDEEEGYYFVMETPKGEIEKYSCVGMIYPLKGVIENYDTLVTIWNLNHKHKAK